MFELIISALAVVTATRVFVPDALRLARRGLAAGVMVGVASLTERGPTHGPPTTSANPRTGGHGGPA